MLLPEDVVEAALGQPAMQRHLPALETLDGDAGARGLTFSAPSASLALAGTDAAAHPDAVLSSPWIIGELIKFHDFLPSFLSFGFNRSPRPGPNVGPWQSCRAPPEYLPARGCDSFCSTPARSGWRADFWCARSGLRSALL